MTSMSEAFSHARRNTRAEKRKFQTKTRAGAHKQLAEAEAEAKELAELMAEAEELDFALDTARANRERGERDYPLSRENGGRRPNRVTPTRPTTPRPQSFSQAGAAPDWRARPAAKAARPAVDLADCRPTERRVIANVALTALRRSTVPDLVDGDLSRIGPGYGFILPI